MWSTRSTWLINGTQLVARFVTGLATISRSLAEKGRRETCRRMSADTKAHQYQTHETIIWVDCEMSGLDIDRDKLMEVALILTNSNLEETHCLGPLIIATDPKTIEGMDDWCTENHTKTGLVKACLESELTIEKADQMLHDLVFKSQGIKNAALGGNSVSYDRLFLQKYCPKFASCLHYRNIDVSSFKEVIRRWYPNDEMFKKRLTHRALDDIRESIAELKYYRQKYFKHLP